MPTLVHPAAAPGGDALLHRLWAARQVFIAVSALVAVAWHLALRASSIGSSAAAERPLLIALVVCGLPLVAGLVVKLWRREFGADLLAGLSIVTALLLHEYLAGVLVVLMLSGGEALEAYAVESASSVLRALARRMPTMAHRRVEAGLVDVALDDVAVGDVLVILPHESCPVDGVVLEGHGVMDESYLTGEPYMMSKTPGAAVLSGAVNGATALTIRATKVVTDSRYAQIMRVMQQSEQQRPRLRRLGDTLGAFYTPVAVGLGVLAWAASGEPTRFLAVLVVATPCPLLIAIPVAIIGSISLAAKRGIIVRNPAALERVDRCRTAIFDKTGTLTYGRPSLTEEVPAAGMDPTDVLRLAASVERYSKHPLASAVLDAARERRVTLREASAINEPPGLGLQGTVDGRIVQLTSRRAIEREHPRLAADLPPPASGLECIVLVDGRFAGAYRFRDAPRHEGGRVVNHLAPKHHFTRVMLVSGDRESEVRYLAEQVGIRDVYAGQTPEDKLALVRAETARADTIFVGDGINDAPALLAATVGLAFGQHSDVTTEAADAVILDSSLAKVDEFLHIGRRMRGIAMQSAVGGMALSFVGMLFAAAGMLQPVTGALLQEAIDVAAVLNALRVARRPRSLTDY